MEVFIHKSFYAKMDLFMSIKKVSKRAASRLESLIAWDNFIPIGVFSLNAKSEEGLICD